MLMRRPTPRRVERRRMAVTGAVVGMACLAVAGFAAPEGSVWITVVLTMIACAVVLSGILRGPRGVPILTYHSVSPNAAWLPWADQISIRPDTLARHLNLFTRMGYTTIQTEDWVAGRTNVSRPLMLHFDDGYLDNRLHAWPLLKAHCATATLFVSTDFVTPGDNLRHDGPDDGYLTWTELQEMDGTPEWRVEAHGTDHGRVVTGPREVGRLQAHTMGREAWMQWQEIPGDKHDWYRRSPVVPVGTPIRESRPALAGPAFKETDAAYRARVTDTLTTARDRIAEKIGRTPRIFCWPQNQTSDVARDIALDVGFVATTAGAHRNTTQDDPRQLSRLHAGQDYAGFRCGWIDDIALRAHLRCFEGAFVWALPLATIGMVRRIVLATRPQSGQHTDPAPQEVRP